MTTTVRPAVPTAPRLRLLYLVRFGFALVWAGLLFSTASGIGAVSATLLVLYPLVDVAAAVVDARSSRRSAADGTSTGTSLAGLYSTVAISALAAVGILAVLSSGVPAVLRVWGVWAVVAGVVQVVVAVRRRRLGGQWAMIASGSLSTVAGTAFVLQSFAPGASLIDVAGYALLGGVFFLVSALRIGRTARA